MNNLQGWLNIYKPLGVTSFEVVKKIKKKFNIKKIGHGGTLDPLAEGVLPIAIGKATKLIPFINYDTKEYQFEIKWGQQTSTDDKQGEIISKSLKIPSSEEINNVLKFFNGEILQQPPKASAVKIQGKRAYELLRTNQIFNIKHKKVFIESLILLKSRNDNISKMLLRCGKGFYVRSLARDIAIKLNTKGHVYSLKRLKVGKFKAKDANLLDDLLKIRQTLSEFKGFHTSTSMLDDILAYEIEDEDKKKFISQGKMIKINTDHLKKPPLNYVEKNLVFLTNKGNIISFGRLNGDLFKPNKVLI